MMEFGNMLDRAVERIVPFKRAITLGVIGLLLAGLIVQTVRLEGFWPFGDGLKEQLEDCEAAGLKVLPTVIEATKDAHKAVDTVKAGVEADNQKARDAAAGSDDPLRDGLGAL